MGSPKHNAADYWQSLKITSDDLQKLTSFLFEKEEPYTLDGLVQVLVAHRMETLALEAELQAEEAGQLYYPRNTYPVGAKLIFPELDWKTGVVTAERAGNNPDLGSFTVSSVLIDGQQQDFATNLESHPLNESNYQQLGADKQDAETILQVYGPEIKARLKSALSNQKELIRIGYTWFPKSLLMDIGKGELNLAEAILDGQAGGPMPIGELLSQLEIVTDDENKKLAEFSLNYALQEDPRFDEVGTSGQFSWFLKRLEPASVLDVPAYLRLSVSPASLDGFSEEAKKIFSSLDDEQAFDETDFDEAKRANRASVVLTYPHWRTGSLPITPSTFQVFPSALETSHVRIVFKDEQTGVRIPAWVVRQGKYVIGLKDWYEDQNLIPGSIVEIGATSEADVITIKPEKKRSNKEWIKTVLVGADGGIVFALLRQSISAGFNERMAIAIPDVAGLDEVWKQREGKNINLKTDLIRMMNELSKLNNQRHVHFMDLYAAMNVIRRTPPQNLLQLLGEGAEFAHVGDFYFHLVENN